jgi:hypothetical protein
MKIHRLAPAGLLAAAFAGIVSCDLVDPAQTTDMAQLTVLLELNADEVAPGDTVDARARIRNVGHAAATITWEASCFGRLTVRRLGGTTPQDFHTDPAPCWTASSPLTIEPGDSVVRSWRIGAVTGEGEPVETGDYLVYLEFSAQLPRGTRVPDVSHSLTVN